MGHHRQGEQPLEGAAGGQLREAYVEVSCVRKRARQRNCFTASCMFCLYVNPCSAPFRVCLIQKLLEQQAFIRCLISKGFISYPPCFRSQSLRQVTRKLFAEYFLLVCLHGGQGNGRCVSA